MELIMKTFKIYRNYLNEKECDLVSNWILNNKNNSCFKYAQMNGVRLTTRYSDNFSFPKISYEIQNRIINTLELKEYSLANFKDGMVASYAEPGDTCFIHTDPIWVKDTITLHCNIKISNSEGGYPIIGEDKIHLHKGDMWIYPVSDIPHGSDIVTGKDPRMLWIFGFSVSKKEIEKIMDNDY